MRSGASAQCWIREFLKRVVPQIYPPNTITPKRDPKLSKISVLNHIYSLTTHRVHLYPFYGDRYSYFFSHPLMALSGPSDEPTSDHPQPLGHCWTIFYCDRTHDGYRIMILNPTARRRTQHPRAKIPLCDAIAQEDIEDVYSRLVPPNAARQSGSLRHYLDLRNWKAQKA